MKHKILLSALSAALLMSCSTYKAGQTPDDVYYSPAREMTARNEKQEDKQDRYEEYVASEDDQYLRRKIQNRDRWSTIDDYSYWYDSRYNHMDCFSYYRYNSWSQPYRYNNGLYNPLLMRPNYYGYGGLYSPSYPIVYYKNPKVYTGTTGKSNLTTYHNKTYNNRNSSNSVNKGSRNEDNFGSLMKKVFSNSNSENSSNNNQSSTWDRPVRTMESGSTPSSSAGGKSGGYNSSGSSSSGGRGPR